MEDSFLMGRLCRFMVAKYPGHGSQEPFRYNGLAFTRSFSLYSRAKKRIFLRLFVDAICSLHRWLLTSRCHLVQYPPRYGHKSWRARLYSDAFIGTPVSGNAFQHRKNVGEGVMHNGQK